MAEIQHILEDLNVPHVGSDHKHGRPGWVQIDCPHCGPGSGKFHLGISLTTGAAACWRCGKQNTASVLATVSGRGFRSIRQALDGATLARVQARPRGRLQLPKGIGPMGEAHRAYLRGRGFCPDTVARLWDVQGIGQTGRHRWRLFIPVIHQGRTVSWTTRSIQPQARARYMSASNPEEAIPHKELLYGADHARHAITIHEGPLDVWAVGPGAVATCGTGFTDHQLLAMSRYPVRVVCFDAGVAAQRRARELADMLSVYPGETHNVQLETGEDPAEAEQAEIQELREAFLE